MSVDDTLPQFICQHCFLYLQHAYAIRLQIRQSNENLLQAQRIADDDSLGLEARQLDQRRITKREIEETNAEAKEEQHFYNTFKNANIKITPNVLKSTARAIEQKCPSCKKRVLSVKGLNDHMELCEISIIDTFFSSFQTIYTRRLEGSLTTKEFILHAIRLVFDANKKLIKIAKTKKIDVNAISSHIPLGSPAPTPPVNQRNYQSPDIGYNSEAK